MTINFCLLCVTALEILLLLIYLILTEILYYKYSHYSILVCLGHYNNITCL